ARRDHHHRRRRLRRRAGASGGKPRIGAGIQLLFRDFARGLRVDLVEDAGARARGRRPPAHHRAPPARARYRGRHRAGAAGRRSPRSRRGGAPPGPRPLRATGCLAPALARCPEGRPVRPLPQARLLHRMTTPPPAQASTAEVLADLELENQRALVRADLDAPVDRSGNVTDTSRIEAAVPTSRALAAAGARGRVGSPFGEFDAAGRGEEGPDAPSIEPAAFALAEQLGMEVLLPDGCTGDSVKRVVTQLREGQVCVLENLAREYDLTSGREALARQLLDHV